MAHLTDEDLLHIADLAKLHLSKIEKEKFKSQLSKVIDFIGHLKEVDVKNVEPTAQVTDLENVTRPDVVNPANILPQEGYFKVDAILSERTDK